MSNSDIQAGHMMAAMHFVTFQKNISRTMSNCAETQLESTGQHEHSEN